MAAQGWWEKSRVHQLRQGSSASGVQTVTENPGVTVDNTDPANPVVGANISTDTPNLIGLGTDDGLFAEDAPSDGTTYGRKDGEWVESGGGALLSAREIRKDFHGISPGDELYAYVSSPMTIGGVSLLANASGNLVVDIRKVTVGGFPADSGDSICASAKPTLSSAQTYVDTTLTGWDTNALPGDTYTFYVDSATTVTDFEITLFGQAEYGELAVSGAFTDTDVGDPVGGSITLSGGDGAYTVDASPVSGTRPPGNGLALVGAVYSDSTGSLTTTGSYSWTDRFHSGDGQTLDVPSSVVVSAATWATWNPADMGAYITLSLSDKRATSTHLAGANTIVRSTGAITGKRYFEMVVFRNGYSGEVTAGGVASNAASLLTYLGQTSDACGVWSPGGGVYVSSSKIRTISGLGVATTQRLDFAVDATNNASIKIWIRKSGGSWEGGGDPATGTTPTATIAITGSLYAAATPYQDPCYEELLANPADMTGTAPSGFTAGIPG